jgi:hypothetical protein
MMHLREYLCRHLALFGLALAASCSLAEAPAPNFCEGITCSSHGNCVVFRAEPTCACDEGFVADSVNGLSCVAVGSSGADAGSVSDAGAGVDATVARDSGSAGSDAGPSSGDTGAAGSDTGEPSPDAGSGADAGGGPIEPAEPCQSAHCRGDNETQEGDGVVCIDEHFAFIPSAGATPNLERYSRTQPIPGEAVVSDALSQLMWTGCPLGLSGGNCQNGSRQSLRVAAQTTACDNLNWAGFSDWVRPDGLLTNSILDRRREQPTLDETLFPWITSNGAGGLALGVTTSNGYGPELQLASGDITFTNSARTASLCVRSIDGGAINHQVRRCFQTTFGVAAMPTTTDPSTGLQWQSCVAGLAGANCASGAASTMTWDAAKQYCDTLDWAGEQDWRLPSLDQTFSISAPRSADEADFAIKTPNSLFLNRDSTHLWTSTPRPYFGNRQFFRARMDRGYVYNANSSAGVRCVRGDRWANEITYPSEVCREMTPVGHAGLRSGDDMQLVRSESQSAGEYLVTDSYYGLQWAGCLLGRSGSQCEHGAVRAVSPGDLEAACSSLQWGAHDDWRVASTNEVRSLFDYRIETHIPMSAAVLAAFPAIEVMDQVRGISGDGRYGEGDLASYIAPNGYLTAPAPISRAVLCVRDHGQRRPRRINRCLQTTAWSRAEGTVTDSDSGIEWMACFGGVNGAGCSNGTRGSVLRSVAIEACEDLIWAGHTNWRLPTANEVLTVYDAHRFHRTKIDYRAFPYWGDAGQVFSGWTSSLGPNQLWRTGNFFSHYSNSRDTNPSFYRCVRSRDGN